jgi:LacI family transcriptional regulator
MSKLIPAGQKRITIKDIANMANVSIGTVDRVLHNRGEVNAATRDRILSFVEELDYTPNLLAKSLALKRNFNIAVLVPEGDKSSPYWTKPIAGIQKAIAELKDYNSNIAIVTFNPGDEQSFIGKFELILSEHPDGIIFAPHFQKASLQKIRDCENQGIPFILIDMNIEASSNLSYFGQDALQSGTVAAMLMHFGLPAGSKVLILKLGWNKAITPHLHRREEGFLKYFLKVEGHAIHTVSLSIDLSRKNEPDESLRATFSSHEDIAGVFVTNSRVHKVARYLARHKKSHIFLVGYDLTEDNLVYLRKGVIDFLICQKPEEQGYNSTMAMFDYLLTHKPVMKINYSPIDILAKENVDYYINSINT